ncbi:SMC-Scp complex subunit ScpB [Amnibacterium setariae]|uniref:SMC-Scp complex subunit ScpB n=1 Tax=Amnibacterium setariae TaxID=2306585 RepID=A0A3A1TZ62_9MICO|nr:SMC-Scp complex subunit ScpB [Amnibacterium setariae]RIX27516.1 SMC-Scp complex subunit ScpB [Amnibacterium setariae]
MSDRPAPVRRTPQEPVALLLSGLLGAPVDEAELAEAFSARDTAAEPAPTGLDAPSADSRDEPVRAARTPSSLDALDEAVEALLVVADRPLDLLTIASALDRPVAVVRQAVERIRDDYDGRSGGRRRGFELRELPGGFRLYARSAHDAQVRHLLEIETAGRLSQAALETLAVVAYRQPVTRGQIAAIRAVSVDSVLKTLVARGLVTEVGRSEETGAVLYGTTDDLLVALGIRSLGELPPLAPLLEGVEAAHADAR